MHQVIAYPWFIHQSSECSSTPRSFMICLLAPSIDLHLCSGMGSMLELPASYARSLPESVHCSLATLHPPLLFLKAGDVGTRGICKIFLSLRKILVVERKTEERKKIYLTFFFSFVYFLHFFPHTFSYLIWVPVNLITFRQSALSPVHCQLCLV